ncbi:MAG: replication-relaxation family protein, partial [Chloroflexi bacterium]|nr:replication-relaxation family protein [Chloroflexota bacterium]
MRVEVALGENMLDDVEHELLRLLAWLPLVPLPVLRPFVACGSSTLHRHARRLVDGDLVRVLSDPWQGMGRPRNLLYLSRRGLARVRGDEPVMLARQLAAGGADAGQYVDLSKLAPLLAVYELLGLVAASGTTPAVMSEWNRPWRRLVPTPRGSVRIVRLPAGATIVRNCTNGPIPDEYVLVPDTGGLALPSIRSSLGRLAEYQARDPASRVVTVIATTTARRAEAWRQLLDSVCSERGVPPTRVQVATWAELRLAAGAHEWRSVRAVNVGGSSSTVERPMARSSAGRALVPPVTPRTKGGVSERQRFSELDRAILELVARHPFLPRALIADVLGGSTAWTRARSRSLVSRGFLRIASAAELNPPKLAGMELLEATGEGLALVCASLGLPVGAAVRHHGLAGGGPQDPIGQRAALIDHTNHTLGADAVFAAIARAVRAHPVGGELVEWRGPAACARGRLRPDGYGLLRVGRQQHGFFLEFDRGTMRPGQLRAKFVAYQRYLVGRNVGHAFAGFPTILVVTISPGAEHRLAAALCAADRAQATSLGALLTTTGWLESTPGGPLGAVWRTSADTRRRVWPD